MFGLLGVSIDLGGTAAITMGGEVVKGERHLM